MNIVIFSRNRACQLELLLRTFSKKVLPSINNPRVVIIYRADNEEFSLAYKKVMERYTDSHFINEADSELSFKNLVLLTGLVDHNKHTMFLVDDDIFINTADISSEVLDKVFKDSETTCLSLRMNPEINRCYTQDRDVRKPISFKDNKWEWKGEEGDWGYPASIDGNIFRTEEIKSLLQDIPFSNPNTMEGQMNVSWNLPGKKMVCHNKSIIVNNPINRVQDVAPNKCGSISAEFLNNAFLSGKRISTEPFDYITNIFAPHTEVSVHLEEKS